MGRRNGYNEWKEQFLVLLFLIVILCSGSFPCSCFGSCSSCSFLPRLFLFFLLFSSSSFLLALFFFLFWSFPFFLLSLVSSGHTVKRDHSRMCSMLTCCWYLSNSQQYSVHDILRSTNMTVKITYIYIHTYSHTFDGSPIHISQGPGLTLSFINFYHIYYDIWLFCTPCPASTYYRLAEGSQGRVFSTVPKTKLHKAPSRPRRGRGVALYFLAFGSG